MSSCPCEVLVPKQARTRKPTAQKKKPKSNPLKKNLYKLKPYQPLRYKPRGRGGKVGKGGKGGQPKRQFHPRVPTGQPPNNRNSNSSSNSSSNNNMGQAVAVSAAVGNLPYTMVPNFGCQGTMLMLNGTTRRCPGEYKTTRCSTHPYNRLPYICSTCGNIPKKLHKVRKYG